MQVKRLAVFLLDTVDDQLIVRGTQGSRDQSLGLTTGEEHGTVLSGNKVRNDGDLADLVRSTAIRTLTRKDLVTLHIALEVMEDRLSSLGLGGVVVVGHAR